MDNMAIGHRQTISNAIQGDGQSKTGSVSGFSDALSKAVHDVKSLQQNADKAIQNLQPDSAGSLHEAMIALEKADVSFRTMMTVRNKLIEAYQEVMRMSV
jgi:flagellar hook-basal body complex protein FliE